MIRREYEMDESMIWRRITEVFRETFDDDEIDLSADTVADEIEGWDSVTNIMMLVAVEREFDVKLHVGEIAGLRNVGELVERIVGHLESAGA